MKKAEKLYMAAAMCAAVLVLFTASGCMTEANFSNTLPGEYNLAGISKIALGGINSLPDDPVNGIYSADETTRKIVEDMIAAKFFKGKTYKIANLDVEKDLYAVNRAAADLAQRYDAILYGRVWWKTSGEYKNIHPVKYTLEKCRHERYMSGKTNNGNPIYSTAVLTETMTDVKVDHPYRAYGATLMLSITIYRLNRHGVIEKVVEDFAVADQQYLLDNGKFMTIYNPHDMAKLSKFEQIVAQGENKRIKRRKAENEQAGMISDSQNSATMPSELQAKIMLSQKLVEALGRKMTNTEIPVNTEFLREYPFTYPIEKKLFKNILAGNYAMARKGLVAEIRKNAGYYISDRIASLSAYPREEVENGEICEDPEALEELKKAREALKKAKDDDERAEIKEEIAELEEELDEAVEDAIDDLENELYALAICEEACGKYNYALETYRCLLKSSVDKRYVLGISRCLASLDMTKRLRKVAKDANKATRKANLQ